MSGTEAIGPMLSRLRRERRWSQARLAELLADAAQTGAITRHEVSRWERGERVPSRYWLGWIGLVAGEPVDVLEAAAATARALRSKLPVPGLILPDLAPDSDMSDRVASAISQPGRVDATTVEWLITCLTQHRRVEDSIGARPLVQVMQAQLDVVAQLARTARDAQRRRLVDLAAQYAQFLGWMGVDLGDQAAASAWYSRAHDWAVEAENEDMAATALSMQAHQAWGVGDTVRCIALAEAAWAYEGRISVGLRGMAAQTAARGHALAGDAEQAHRCLDEAGSLLAVAADPEVTEPAWLYFFDEAWFTRQRGTIELQLGNYSSAAELLSRGISTIAPDYRRDRAWIGGCLALAYAESGHIEAAVSIAVDVAPDARAVSRYGLEKLHQSAHQIERVAPSHVAPVREALAA